MSANPETSIEQADHFAPSDVRAVPGGAPITLFRSDDPDEIIARSTRVATALAKVIKDRKLASLIPCRDHKNAPEEVRRRCLVSGGDRPCREHVRVEGWSLLGTMLGVYPLCAWSRPLLRSVVDPKAYGWEARVEARTRSGDLVGAGEAQCTRDESAWGYRDDYALRSMAQTRATSKALRLPLGFVMSLAGFDPTPAEEIPPGGFDEERSGAPAARSEAGPASQKQRGAILGLLKRVHPELKSGKPEAIHEALNAHLTALGEKPIASSKDLTRATASKLIDRLSAAAKEPRPAAGDPATDEQRATIVNLAVRKLGATPETAWSVVEARWGIAWAELQAPVADEMIQTLGALLDPEAERTVDGVETPEVAAARDAQDAAAAREGATDDDLPFPEEEVEASTAAPAARSPKRRASDRSIGATDRRGRSRGWTLPEQLRHHARLSGRLTEDGRIRPGATICGKLGLAPGEYDVDVLARDYGLRLAALLQIPETAPMGGVQ